MVRSRRYEDDLCGKEQKVYRGVINVPAASCGTTNLFSRLMYHVLHHHNRGRRAQTHDAGRMTQDARRTQDAGRSS